MCFFELIINKILTKIIEYESTPIGLNKSRYSNKSSDDVDDCSESNEVDDYNFIQMPVHSIEDKDNFSLFIQYRAKCSEHYARAIHKNQAPCTVIMTLRKLKTVIPSLKPPIDLDFRSDVIYQIECPHCPVRYVNESERHIITIFKEHQNRNAPL